MARLKKLIIDGYRSVDHAELVFPDDTPLVLIGENNAGKSNIVRAFDLLCGEIWPSSHAPEDNEFYQRNRDRPIKISAEFSEALGRWEEICWHYDANNEPAVEFGGVNGLGQIRFMKGEEREQTDRHNGRCRPTTFLPARLFLEVHDAFQAHASVS